MLISDEVKRKKNQLEKFFMQIYQSVRTISLIPSIRNIQGANRKAAAEDVVSQGRFSMEGHETIQQLYNNLVTNTNVSEVYVVLDGLKPDEVPFLMYDSYILGEQSAIIETGIVDSHDYPEEEEEEEYSYYPKQIDYLKGLYPAFNFKGLDNIPAVSSPPIRTCDNTQYISELKGDILNTLGILYSVPFYNKNNRLSGIVSAIFRLNVIEAILLDVPFLIVTDADRKKAEETGFTMPEQKGDFVLVNEDFDIFIADRRDDELSNTIKKSGPDLEAGNLYVEDLDIKDSGQWKLYYRFNPTILNKAVEEARQSFFYKFFTMLTITIIVSIWGFKEYRSTQKLKKEIRERKKAEKLISQSKHDWEDTFNNITDMITVHDSDYNIIRANRSAEKSLNLPITEKSKSKCFRHFHGMAGPPESCPGFNCYETKEPAVFEIFEPHLNRYIEIRAIPRIDSKKNVAGLIHVVRDITERKRSEKDLHESEERYRSLVESTDDSIYLVDRDYKYLFINTKHLTRLGVDKDRYTGEPYARYHTEEETHIFSDRVDKVFATKQSDKYEFKSSKDGKYFLQTFSPVIDKEGNVKAATIVSKDISELKQMEMNFKALSLTDDLTGLYNRRGFFTMLKQQIKVAKRQNKKLYLLYADIDNFKIINDTLGHSKGDQALIEAAHIIKATYRESDIISRIGGDEFVVFPVGFPGDDMDVITGRLQKKVDAFNEAKVSHYTLSISVGVAMYDPESSTSADELMAQADALMYKNKKRKADISLK